MKANEFNGQKAFTTAGSSSNEVNEEERRRMIMRRKRILVWGIFVSIGVFIFLWHWGVFSYNCPAWHKTADGIWVYCIANDKHPLRWEGDVAGCLADGEGQLISYKKNGAVKKCQTICARLGVAKDWNYVPLNNYLYLGELDDDEPNGFGVKIYKDTISIGEFRDSHLYNGLCEKYLIQENEVLPVLSGIFEKGKLNGMAKHYVNGIISFEGSMHNGHRKGFGKEYQNGELVYEGSFKNDMRNGFGKAYKNGLLWYDGAWKKGKRDGQGKLYNENGIIIYEGEWDNDVYDGKGKLYENGVCLEGKWDEGRLVKSISTSPFEQVVHATRIWLNIDSTNVDDIEDENSRRLPASQMEFVTQLQSDLDSKLREDLSDRVEKRFGFWHLLRMWIQPWATSDVKRAKNAQSYLCRNTSAKDIQQLINAKIDYYNRNVSVEEKLNYVQLQSIPNGAIVDANVALKIFDREAMETTDTIVGIFIDILLCWVIAFVLGFIIGLFFPPLIPYVGVVDIIMTILAIVGGIYVSIVKTSTICVELERQILDMLVNNYIQYIDSQNVIAQMLGLL